LSERLVHTSERDDLRSSCASWQWRRFFRLAAGTAVLAVVVIYAFVVLVDPFDTLPLSPPLHRGLVASNQRYSYPSAARSARFDSAVFGTSTSRMLRPDRLDAAFGGHFANLAMNAATPYEQARLIGVFRAAHPTAHIVVVGIDLNYCVTGNAEQLLTPRSFPAWMYAENGGWPGYREMFNLFAVQEAGQQFGFLIGMKRPFYRDDGYADFLPPDSDYDPARVAEHTRLSGIYIPPGTRDGAPAGWRYPAIERLGGAIASFADTTRKILYFVPYSRRITPLPDSADGAVWAECKRRATALARQTPNSLVLDFMLPTPITDDANNYWDGLHYRHEIAGRIVDDLAAAEQGLTSPDYVRLADDRPSASRTNSGTAATRSDTRTFSVGVCASAMSPGPSTTQGAIACNSEASVP
jgi:hypothetical protein